MRRFNVLALLLFALPAFAAKVEQLPQRLVTEISADVTVDADGHLTSIGELSVPLDAQALEIVRAEMQALRFKPGRADGKPAPVQTHLTLTVGLDNGAAPGEYTLALVKASTGPRMGAVRPPRYPKSLLTQGREAVVMMRVQYDGNGKVVEAAIESSNVPQHYIEREVMQVAQAWTFEPERVDGKGIAAWAMVPVRFQLYGTSSAQFVVKLASGSKLLFHPEPPPQQRDAYASVLDPQVDGIRELPLGPAAGS